MMEYDPMTEEELEWLDSQCLHETEARLLATIRKLKAENSRLVQIMVEHPDGRGEEHEFESAQQFLEEFVDWCEEYLQDGGLPFKIESYEQDTTPFSVWSFLVGGKR